MDMDGLNAVTVFVTLSFVVSGFVGLAELTDFFDREAGVLFLGTGIMIFLVSLYRTSRSDEEVPH